MISVRHKQMKKVELAPFAVVSQDLSQDTLAKWLLRLTRITVISNPFGGAGSNPASVEFYCPTTQFRTSMPKFCFRKRIPGPIGLPIIGNLYQLKNDFHKRLFDWYDIIKFKLKKENERLIGIDCNDNEKDEEKDSSILGKLLNEYNNGTISFENITGTCCDLCMAGTDTAGDTLTFSLIAPTNYKSCQDKLYNEIKKTLNDNNNDEILNNNY
ncbi:hypothetical protein ACTA71_008665 [Dictyostelium dimigraforme]